jgi:transposase
LVVPALGRYEHWELHRELPCNAKKADAQASSHTVLWNADRDAALVRLIEDNPTLYLDEMAAKLKSQFHCRFTVSSISKRLTRLGYSRKLIYEKASQAIYTEQQLFIAALRHYLHNAEMAIFVDESNKDRVAAKRKYGWSKVGVQANYKMKFNADTRYSLLGAADCFGFVIAACETVLHKYKEKEEHAPVDTDRFVRYVEEKLVPVLGNFLKRERRSVVIMDNCSIHMDPRVRELIEAAGAILVYSAPYSPELIPIEFMFANWKMYLKRHNDEFCEDWYTVHLDALRSVTPQMGLNFFEKTTLVELVANHPQSEEYTKMAETVAVLLTVGIL